MGFIFRNCISNLWAEINHLKKCSQTHFYAKSKQIWIRSFKWGTVWPWSSKGCKTTGSHSWRLEKNVLLYPGPHFFESTLIWKTIFSRSPTLTPCSFIALWATRLHCTSFERSNSYLLVFSWKMDVTELLTLLRLA